MIVGGEGGEGGGLRLLEGTVRDYDASADSLGVGGGGRGEHKPMEEMVESCLLSYLPPSVVQSVFR